MAGSTSVILGRERNILRVQMPDSRGELESTPVCLRLQLFTVKEECHLGVLHKLRDVA